MALSGAGCGKSARPVLRRGSPRRLGESTQPLFVRNDGDRDGVVFSRMINVRLSICKKKAMSA